MQGQEGFAEVSTKYERWRNPLTQNMPSLQSSAFPHFISFILILYLSVPPPLFADYPVRYIAPLTSPLCLSIISLSLSIRRELCRFLGMSVGMNICAALMFLSLDL